MAKRRRKKKTNYFARRLVLVLLLVALAGFLLLKVIPWGEEEPEEEAAQPQASQSESQQEESLLESAVQERESAAESEPEPDPAPVTTTDWNLLLVNGITPLPADFVVPELELVNDYRVDARIADDIRRMFTQAREDGITLQICSAYRSVEKQEENYANQLQTYINQGKSQEEAEELTAGYYAKPGTSEHHTGLAVDIITPEYQTLDEGYADTPAAKWLVENAHKFGFILRYPKNKESITQINFEPWHYRYVGVEHAVAIKETGYCLEEYIWVATRDSSQSEGEPQGETDAGTGEAAAEE